MFSSLSNLAFLDNAKSRSISAENPTGGKGMGAMATTEGAAWSAARELGLGWKTSPYYVIAPGGEFCLADIEGSGVIESIWWGGNISRDYILRFYWDGCETPAVEAPLAEFFAYGWVSDKYLDNPVGGPFDPLVSLAVCVNPNRGLNCYWQMPFRKHCRVTIENRSQRDYVCYYQINYSLQEIPENAGYFHAQYRQKKIVDFKEEYVILDNVSGKGRYVGTAFFPGIQGDANWWGEGEVKFFMDGDTEFPTICTTGTEDYFCGAYDWEVDGEYVPHNSPYAGVSRVIKPDGLYQYQTRFSMYRWHITDPIRFEENIKVTIQDLGWKEPGLYLARRDEFASVAYWYSDQPGLAASTLPTRDELRIY